MAVGSWWLAVDSGWQLAVAGGWRLAVPGVVPVLKDGGSRLAVGGWRLAVGGPWGLSLKAVLNKKNGLLKDIPGPDHTATQPPNNFAYLSHRAAIPPSQAGRLTHCCVRHPPVFQSWIQLALKHRVHPRRPTNRFATATSRLPTAFLSKEPLLQPPSASRPGLPQRSGARTQLRRARQQEEAEGAQSAAKRLCTGRYPRSMIQKCCRRGAGS